MNKLRICSATALLLMGGALCLGQTLRVVATLNGDEVKTFQIKDGDSFSFSNEGLTHTSADGSSLLAWNEFDGLNFPDSGAGIMQIEGTERSFTWKVTDTALFLDGLDGATAPLTIVSLNGQMVMRIEAFAGQADISSLEPGLYVAAINNTSFKFLKK